jgi:alkylhydroperoxidase family enzyme
MPSRYRLDTATAITAEILAHSVGIAGDLSRRERQLLAGVTVFSRVCYDCVHGVLRMPRKIVLARGGFSGKEN